MKNYFFKIKIFIRKFYVLIIKKIINKFIYSPIINNKRITFDNYQKNKELLAVNKLNEKYIVNSSDTVIGRSLYIKGTFEFDNFLDAIRILEKKITKKTLIDIGANIGSICIPAIKRGIFSNCIAIEPDPYNFNLLSKNIFINEIVDKIKTFNFALGQFDNKKIEFELSEYNFGDHRIKSYSSERNSFNENNRKIITVITKKLDTIMQNFNPSETLIWMDVQGYEAFVMDGGINTLTKKPPLVIEFEPYLIDRFNTFNLLKKNIMNIGYKNCYNLNSKYFFKDLTENNLDNLYTDLKKQRLYSAANLLFFE